MAGALHDIIKKFHLAEAAYNDMPASSLTGLTAEKATFDEAYEALKATNASATTYDGAMAALRFASREMNDFASDELVKPLVNGALAYFEKLQADRASANSQSSATISALYPLWLERFDFDPLGTEPETAVKASYEIYRALQIAIEGTRPATAAEYAMKLIACTDDFDSEYPAPLEDEVREIAKAALGTAGVPSPDLVAIMAAYLEKEAAWYATMEAGCLSVTGAEVEAYEAALDAFEEFQCTSHKDVQAKLRFVGQHQGLREAIAADRFDSFSASLTLPPTVSPSAPEDSPHEKIGKLSWEISDLLNGIYPRIDYVTIRASSEGKHAVMTGFDVALPEEVSDCPMASAHLSLPSLVERLRTAKDAWEAEFDIDEKSDATEAAWAIYMEAEADIVRMPCATIEGVWEKVAFFQGGDNTENLRQDSIGEESAMAVFLRSIAKPRATQRRAFHSLPAEAAARGETFQPHQNGEDA